MIACDWQTDKENASIVLVASHTRSFDRGDDEAVQGVDKLIEKCEAKRRAARVCSIAPATRFLEDGTFIFQGACKAKMNSRFYRILTNFDR